MKKAVIIVAGGSGSRMKSEIPKQFLVFCGLPILMHTINAFLNYDKNIKVILVLPKEQVAYWSELCMKYGYNKNIQVALGGATRFASVKSGLEYIDEEMLVGVHDGVRPLVSFNTLERVYNRAFEQGNAIPVIDAFESVRLLSTNGNNALNRDTIKLVQTPQVFTSKILKEAYQQEFNPVFTDDASVVEKAGYKVNLVQGNRENIKITTPIDLKIAEALFF